MEFVCHEKQVLAKCNQNKNNCQEKKDSFVAAMSVDSNNNYCLVSLMNFTKCLLFVTCCRSHSFIDVTGVGSESPFAVNESCKIVNDTVVIDHESDNEHDISDKELIPAIQTLVFISTGFYQCTTVYRIQMLKF